MGDITTRVITGFFFNCHDWRRYSEWVFFFNFIFLVSGVVYQWVSWWSSTIYSPPHQNGKQTYKLINTVFSVIIFGIVFLVASNKIPLISWSVVCGFPLTWLVIEMYTKSEKPFYNVCLNSMAIFYLAIPLSSSCLLAFHAGEYSWHYLLAIMIFAWSNDSFAYLLGKVLR